MSNEKEDQSQAVPSELASFDTPEFRELLEKHRHCARWATEGVIDEICAYLFSHSAATGKVPEGWKLVPLEPTQAMNSAGYMKNLELGSGKRNPADTYKAMLAASPAAPLAGKAEPAEKDVIGMLRRALDKSCLMQDGSVRAEIVGHFCNEWNAALSAPLAAAVPAEETSYLRDASHPRDMQQAMEWITGLRNRVDNLLDSMNAPAEPAPIQASALTDERIRELASEVYLMDYQDDSDGYDIAIARIIEREVLARLSKPTAQGVAQSIDTDEFRALLEEYDDAASDSARRHARNALVSFINRHIAAQATAGRDAQQWISVDEQLPECSKKPGSLGVEVIVYPQPEKGESTAFYGCRITDEPDFYKYGSRISGVTHWMHLPAAPQSKTEA